MFRTLIWNFLKKFLRHKVNSSVGHSATAFRNFTIRQLSIPQNYIWQHDQNAKTFGKKCLAINHSENRHSETFIQKITIWRKNIQKIYILQLFIVQNHIWKKCLSETSCSDKYIPQLSKIFLQLETTVCSWKNHCQLERSARVYG